MARDYTKMLLITANVGSIFEDPDRMLQLWMQEFLKTVKRLDPDFLAVHCQEVGGKNYEQSMQHVNSFIKTLLASENMQQFDKARVFLDEDFTAVDKFTALGNLYFIHQCVQDVQIWDHNEHTYVPVHGREVLSGNIENVGIKQKEKFPQQFFPECKWSRKGFIRTRWKIRNTQFDVVNIHLFHDASNILAMESTPSPYSENRNRALQHTVDRFDNDELENVPYFMFGDFNFRLDTYSLVKKLAARTTAHETIGKKNEVSKVVYKAADNGKAILTIEKKGFDHHDNHDPVFSNCNNRWLNDFDIEPHAFLNKLLEFEVTFPPSYPFSEDTEDGRSYMKTRCPSWCDRVMLSHTAKDLVVQDEDANLEYTIMGPNVCMGDHKPVYLNFKMRHGPALSSEAEMAEMAEENIPRNRQIRISEIETTKYIHVRQNGTSVRVFRETSV